MEISSSLHWLQWEAQAPIVLEPCVLLAFPHCFLTILTGVYSCQNTVLVAVIACGGLLRDWSRAGLELSRSVVGAQQICGGSPPSRGIPGLFGQCWKLSSLKRAEAIFPSLARQQGCWIQMLFSEKCWLPCFVGAEPRNRRDLSEH